MMKQNKKPPVIDLILDQVQAEGEDEWRPPRPPDSFRGSELGDCPRFIQWQLLGKKAQPFYPETRLIFEDGHLHHDQVRARLRSIGRVTNVEHGTFKKYNRMGIDFTVTATFDGMLNGEFPFDVKSINVFSFGKLTDRYIRLKYEGYILQLQLYMDILDKEWGFLIFKDKTFSGLKLFWFQRDTEMLNDCLDRMAQILIATRKGKLVKKPYTKGSKECKFCPMRIHCHEVPMERRRWSK